MKRVIQLTWFQMFAICCLSFSMGFSTMMLIRKPVPENHVPQIVFSPLVLLDSLSMQIAYEDFGERSMTVWIREDRRQWFISESTLPAQTTITKMAVDCDQSSIFIEEQRVFGFAMQHIATIKGRDYFEGKQSIIMKHLFTVSCEIEPEQPVQQPTGLTA